MDKTAILCEKDKHMLYEFSKRSLDHVDRHSLLFISLPFLSSYVDANVKKEVEKDRLIIREAAEAYAAGKPACDLDLEDIFEKTKQVDKAFLDNLRVPVFSLKVRYSDFSDIRIQRIWRIARTVYAILRNWPETATFADAVRNAYSEKEFNEIIMQILHLYNHETRLLGTSIKFFPPFRKAMIAAAETLFQAMEDVTADIAGAYSKQVFGDKIVHA